MIKFKTNEITLPQLVIGLAALFFIFTMFSKPKNTNTEYMSVSSGDEHPYPSPSMSYPSPSMSPSTKNIVSTMLPRNVSRSSTSTSPPASSVASVSNKPKISTKTNEFDEKFMKLNIEIDKTNAIRNTKYDWDNTKNNITNTRHDKLPASKPLGHKPYVEVNRDMWSTNLADV